MNVCTRQDKSISSPCDTLALLVGKIVIATKNGEFRFSSKLIEVRDNEIWFQNRNGLRWMVRRDAISSISELPTYGRP